MQLNTEVCACICAWCIPLFVLLVSSDIQPSIKAWESVDVRRSCSCMCNCTFVLELYFLAFAAILMVLIRKHM
jgi:hypothetical protein